MSGLNFHPIKLLGQPFSRTECGAEQYVPTQPERTGTFCDYGILQADQLVDGDAIGRSCEFSKAALGALQGADPVFHSGRAADGSFENPLLDYQTPFDIENASGIGRKGACLFGVDPTVEQASVVPQIFESEVAISDGFWAPERDQFWNW